MSFGESRSYGRISSIVKDDQGFLWFGTNSGLQRYDGYRLREFQHDPGNPKGLSGSYINTLFKDRSGNLWVASDEYLERYDPATESFTHSPSVGGGIEGWVWHISQDRTGTLWLATHAGLARLDPASWQIVRHKHRPGDPTSLSSDFVTSTFEQRDGTFWVATTDGLDIFDRRTGKVTRHFPLPQHTPTSLQVESVVDLFEDHANVLWVIYSFGNGLARVDRQHNRLVEYSLAGDGSDRTPLAGVRAIYESEDGTLWLGSASRGILKLDRQRQRFIRYRHDPRYPDSLSSDQIVALLGDQGHNIWVGTTGGGLDRLNDKPLPFKTYRHEEFNPNSLESNYTTSVFEDSRGDLWVGSIKVLTRIDRKTGHFTFYRTAGRPGSLSSTWVISIAEDRSGYLWFGTLGKGLDRYDPRSGRFKVYRHHPADAHSLSHDNVLSLFVDHKGTLWAGTEDGLSAFDPVTERFRVYRPPGAAPLRRYRAMAEDPEGALWLGTLGGGLQRLDPTTGDFTVYRQESEGLSSDQVNAVCVDRSGSVWAGTQNGLNRFDRTTGKFTTYYERDGLPDGSVNSILEDAHGDLWLSTGNGLSQFSPPTKTFSNYYTSDGLLGNEFYNYANAYKSPTGEMFFNSYAGVIAFFPNQIVEAPRVPPVVLTDFLLFGKPVSIGGSDSPLKASISLTKSITLSHAQDIFSLQFSALSFADPARNRYRYQLEGLEKQWNETDSSHRSATYTTLRPGKYVFRVQARTNRGAWTGNGASLRIRILPPWWSTWWFRTGCAALLLFSLWAVYEFRRQQAARQFALEEQFRQGLINAQEEERTRIARELHDDIGQQIAALSISLSLLRRQIPAQDSEVREQTERLHQRLAQIATALRNLSHELHPAILEHAGLAAALRSLCAEFSSLNSVRVSFQAAGSFQDLPAAVGLCVYRLVQEALQNVAKHAAAKDAEVSLLRANNVVCLTVADHGVGFDPSRARASGGLGLASMRERVRLVNGILVLESEPNRGTTLKVNIPIREEADVHAA